MPNVPRLDRLTPKERLQALKDYDGMPRNSRGTLFPGDLCELAYKWRVSKETILLLVRQRRKESEYHAK